jgi:hypothetical protein
VSTHTLRAFQKLREEWSEEHDRGCRNGNLGVAVPHHHVRDLTGGFDEQFAGHSHRPIDRLDCTADASWAHALAGSS